MLPRRALRRGGCQPVPGRANAACAAAGCGTCEVCERSRGCVPDPADTVCGVRFANDPGYPCYCTESLSGQAFCAGGGSCNAAIPICASEADCAKYGLGWVCSSRSQPRFDGLPCAGGIACLDPCPYPSA